MPFNKGTVTFRAYRIFDPKRKANPDAADVAARLEDYPPPQDEQVTDAVISGFSHADSVYNSDVAAGAEGSTLHAAFVASERKIDSVKFKSQVADEVAARKKVRGLEFLSRKERREVIAEVRERLLPSAPVVRKPTPFYYEGAPTGPADDPRVVHLFASTISDNAVDDFVTMWTHAAGFPLTAMFPDIEAKLVDPNYYQADPALFTTKTGNCPVLEDVGADFMTWLLYTHHSDAPRGLPGDFAIQGPFVFDDGDTKVTVSGDRAEQAPAAATALQSGKKLVRARLLIDVDGSAVTTTVDSTFAFRSAKIELGDDDMGAADTMAARVEIIDLLVHQWYEAFRYFMRLRVHENWKALEGEIRTWVASLERGLS